MDGRRAHGQLGELAGTARRDFADTVAPLSDAQLAQPTLCAEWDAKDVHAHLVMFVELGAFGFVGTIAKHRRNFDKAWLANAAKRHDRPVLDERSGPGVDRLR